MTKLGEIYHERQRRVEAFDDLLAVAIEARRLLRQRRDKSISEHKLLDALDAAIKKSTS